MATRYYETLPPARTWSPDVEAIAERIIAEIGDAPLDQAALYLMFRMPGQQWATPEMADNADSWELIDALLVATASTSSLEDHRLAQLVAAFAVGYDVADLGRLVRDLSPASRDALTDAIRTAGGVA